MTDVIKRYSNFVGSTINMNGSKANTVQPLWLMDAKKVTAVMHDEFYRFISNAYDKPRFILHYKTDVPLSVRALLYVPEGKPGKKKIFSKTLNCNFFIKFSNFS